MNGSDLLKALEKDFPRTLAYEWDNVGVMIGTMNKQVTTVLLTLDVTKETVKKAKEIGAELIIAHHPLIFGSLTQIHYDTYKGQIIRDIIKEDITVYAMHTNYDLAEGGMNDMLAARLGLTNVAPLEMVDDQHGIGRIGTLTRPMSLDNTITHIKKTLKIDHARYIGKPGEKQIETVALSGGSGADHAPAAKRKGADLYITGDVSYHKAHDMLQMGLRTLDVGHSAEKHFKSAMSLWLETHFETLRVTVFEDSQDPFTQV